MGKQAGVITIRLNAGTAEFVQAMDRAKAKVIDFGSASAGNTRNTVAAFKVLDGSFPIRSAANFANQMLGLGPIINAAFPIIGAIAFGGMLVKVGADAVKFFRDVQQSGERANNAFRELNGPLKLTNDELALTNARLENQLAKLEGRHENTLKVAALEAKEAFDKLAESIEKNLAALNKLMKEQAIGSLGGFATGRGPTKALQQELGGETGLGGFAGRVRGMLDQKANPAVLKAAYEEEIEKIQKQFLEPALYQQGKYLARTGGPAKFVPPEMRSGFDRAVSGKDTTYAADQSVLIEQARGAISNLREQASFVGMEGEHGRLAGALPGAERAAKDVETFRRINAQLLESSLTRDQVLEKIDADEQKEIENLDRSSKYYERMVDMVEAVYDGKRLTAYTEKTEELTHALAEADNEWRKRVNESTAKSPYDQQIEEGRKRLEEDGKNLEKWAAKYSQILSNTDKQALEHKIRQVGLRYGSGDPAGVLALEQDLKRQDIMERYNNSLKSATSTMEKASIIKQKNLEIDQLAYEKEEQAAAARQKGVGDFFLEMERQAQSAGNILYDSMHSALDRVSDQFAKLFTGQKTSFGRMFQGIAEEMIKSSIKSAAQRGLGAIGKALGIKLPEGKPDGTKEKPLHVLVDNPAANRSGSEGTPGLPATLSAVPLFGTSGGIFSALSAAMGVAGTIAGLFGGGGGADAAPRESVTSNISYRAAGGSLSPSDAYIVGERGPELLTKTSGYITSNSELRRQLGGGNGPVYHIDARGADLGASNRIARGLEMTHNTAVSNSVRATAERTKRTPQRSGA